MSYRKIYNNYHGLIPIDEYGRPYDIHHIDRNKSNNSIENLVALSIEEHYNAHYVAGEYRAAHAILLRMNKPTEQIRKLASMAAKERVENGTHHWLGGEHQRNLAEKLKAENRLYVCSEKHSESMTKINAERVMQGIHNFQSPEAKISVSIRNRENIANGSHPFLNGVGAENSRKRVLEVVHHFQNSDAQKERSNKARLKNSFIIERIDPQGQKTTYLGISIATKSNPGMTHKKIEYSHTNNVVVDGYYWKNLGKGISSTTISSESTEQAIGSGKAAHLFITGDDIV